MNLEDKMDKPINEKRLGTFLNPFTDFGFKKIFGCEESKPFLMSFLNDLLPLENPIVHLEFKNIEKLGMVEEDRKAIYDIYCHDKKGNQFIVELQRAKQQHFQDRAAYYSTFLIHEQAKKGQWDFKLTPIYFIGILDFSLPSFADNNYLHFGQLTDIYTKEVMYKKLNFIYIEMDKFKKTENQLANHLEWWLYFLKKLVTLDEVPAKFQNDIIAGAFDIAKLSNMSYATRHEYENSLKHYRDFINVLDTAKKEGIEIGIEQGENKKAIKIAINMLKKQADIDLIAEVTELTQQQINALKTKINSASKLK